MIERLKRADDRVQLYSVHIYNCIPWYQHSVSTQHVGRLRLAALTLLPPLARLHASVSDKSGLGGKASLAASRDT